MGLIERNDLRFNEEDVLLNYGVTKITKFLKEENEVGDSLEDYDQCLAETCGCCAPGTGRRPMFPEHMSKESHESH